MNSAKTRLYAALIKLVSASKIEKVSVDMILKEAQVSRQTFYKYFPDKYSLAFSIYTNQAANMLYQGRGDTFDDKNRIMLEVLKTSPRFYINLFSDPSASNLFRKYFHEGSVQRAITIIGEANITKDLMSLFQVWCTGTDALIADWVLSGMQEEPEYLISIFRRSMPIELAEYYLKHTL